jgi:hypothetical protein
MRRRREVGPADETAPFRCHHTVATLSDELCTVFSRISKCCAKTSSCATPPANSSSLLVMVPAGLSDDTSRCAISAGKGARQRIGSTVPSSNGTKWTPPMPAAAASWAPRVDGVSVGTNSANLVGRVAKSFAKSRKSARMACTG